MIEKEEGDNPSGINIWILDKNVEFFRSGVAGKQSCFFFNL